MKNLILVDMPVDNDWELKRGIEGATKSKWEIKYKEGRLSCSKIKRISNYFCYPLYILLSTSKVKKLLAAARSYDLTVGEYLFELMSGGETSLETLRNYLEGF